MGPVLGSRVATARRPRACRCATSRGSCVVVPDPSIPSRATKTARPATVEVEEAGGMRNAKSLELRASPIYTEWTVAERPYWLRAAAALAVIAAVGAPATGCRRSRDPSAARNASSAPLDARDVRCVERPEGCVFCEGRGPASPLVDPDALSASLCDPKDAESCVDFCTTLAPECAVPWRTGESCLAPSELEFRRQL